MFYAGEYLRQFVVVAGRPCEADADCGSLDYECRDGACTDPPCHCRENVLIVFTDGYESEHPRPDDFFNPRRQARRFRYGLGCDSDADCIGGATCVAGACDHPPTLNGHRWRGCRDSLASCRTDGTLVCEGGARCVPWTFRYTEGEGADLLRAPDGSPIQLTTYVVNVSGESDTSVRIA
ncbi:MAG: hypothetical protein M5T61_20875 [Acidimicrobiia bacterium]|nr:hypothetical protein [Acidimicrobiia bacterium]